MSCKITFYEAHTDAKGNLFIVDCVCCHIVTSGVFMAENLDKVNVARVPDCEFRVK